MSLHRKHRAPAEGMKRYVGYVSISLVGCRKEFTFDIEEDASEAEIEEAGREAMLNEIEWGFDPPTA